jgi:CRISPR-associated endonuclease/helicase Cas3
MPSLSDRIQGLPPFATVLRDAGKYWGHIHPEKTPEPMADHVELVMRYFGLLCQAHGLDQVVDTMIGQLVAKSEEQLQPVLKDALLDLFVQVPYFHDYGKINENFQLERLKNPAFRSVKNELSHHHSLLGAYHFVVVHLEKYNRLDLPRREKVMLLLTVLCFAYPIIKHHSAHLGEITDGYKVPVNQIRQMQRYLAPYGIQVPDSLSVEVIRQVEGIIFAQWPSLDLPDFPLYALIKLNFSLLTAADYYATSHYMNDWPREYEDFGLISPALREKVVQNARSLKSYNRQTYAHLNTILQQSPDQLQEISNANLNALRGRMVAEVIKNVQLQGHRHLFYLEAPTGGGKTNMAMLATAELLDQHPELNKVFFVFPFTTLITQTHQAILDTLGLSQNEVTQLHAKAGWQTKGQQEEADALYGQEKLNFIDNLFVNYPFCLLSHVRFFEILCTSGKERNYLLHRLANSVVIIDELQSYNPAHWDKIIYFVDRYAEAFNIRFLLMSATLPKLDKLGSVVLPDTFVHLLPDAISRFFQNPNFRNRVTFRFDLLSDPEFQRPANKDEEAREAYLLKLTHFLLDRTRERREQYPEQPVRTVIEFIFKKTASQFFQLAENLLREEYDQIYVLSGTILEPRRKETINYLKSQAHQQENILLITTQVVEAGVDIDMDLGFKDTSLIDSEEQLAGRINRNVNKESCQLFLFDLDSAEVIYGKDYRYEEQQKERFQKHYVRVLQEKAFDELYLQVFTKINQANQQEFLKNFNDYRKHLQYLDFPKADREFRLINQENVSVFVPLPVPVQVEGIETGTFESLFSGDELAFLAAGGVVPAFHEVAGEEKEAIHGYDVFDLYTRWIMERKEKKDDFTADKVVAKRLQGILSKFVFSVITYSRTMEELKTFGEERYGYFYLANTQPYNYVSGINDNVFKEAVFI